MSAAPGADTELGDLRAIAIAMWSSNCAIRFGDLERISGCRIARSPGGL
jgi:hypothetical protein